MFAAAMLYSTPGLELSIYSTCKRISQKLMRNVTKFLNLIYDALPNEPKMPIIRCNMEEVLLQGPDGVQDVRIVNSYPSQVMFCILLTQPLAQKRVEVLPRRGAPEQVHDILGLLKSLNHVRLRARLKRLQSLPLPAQVRLAVLRHVPRHSVKRRNRDGGDGVG